MERERIRDRMKREMDLRGFRPRTQHAYLRVCRKLVEYYGGELKRLRRWLTRARVTVLPWDSSAGRDER